MSNDGKQQSDAPLAEFSMSMSDREVLELILLTMRELRGHIVRIVGYTELVSDALENPDAHAGRPIESYVAPLSENAGITQQCLVQDQH